MSSDRRAYVWTWLAGAAEPVVAGVLQQQGPELWFTYGRSYLRRSDAVPLQPAIRGGNRPGLPLREGPQRPPLPPAHGVIRDGAPDAWGMRVILRRLLGTGAQDVDELPLLTYLLESGSNRIGCLDFQASSDRYVARRNTATLEDLLQAAERIEQGKPFSPALDDALVHGTAVGGARPKALLRAEDGTELIAKFSVSTDVFPWMQAEAVGMELARRCGVRTAPSRLVRVAGRDVLLVERFDRPGRGTREQQLSVLTLLGLHELAARHASYVDLSELVRLQFVDPESTRRELFTRIVVNVLVGNTDDHARNHAAFVRGDQLELTPAYDIAPQPRSTGEAAQAMAYGPDGTRAARLDAVASHGRVYGLAQAEAVEEVDRCRTLVTEQYHEVCGVVGADEATASRLWRRAVLNPSIEYPNDV